MDVARPSSLMELNADTLSIMDESAFLFSIGAMLRSFMGRPSLTGHR